MITIHDQEQTIQEAFIFAVHRGWDLNMPRLQDVLFPTFLVQCEMLEGAVKYFYRFPRNYTSIFYAKDITYHTLATWAGLSRMNDYYERLFILCNRIERITNAENLIWPDENSLLYHKNVIKYYTKLDAMVERLTRTPDYIELRNIFEIAVEDYFDMEIPIDISSTKSPLAELLYQYLQFEK